MKVSSNSPSNMAFHSLTGMTSVDSSASMTMPSYPSAVTASRLDEAPTACTRAMDQADGGWNEVALIHQKLAVSQRYDDSRTGRWERARTPIKVAAPVGEEVQGAICDRRDVGLGGVVESPAREGHACRVAWKDRGVVIIRCV